MFSLHSVHLFQMVLTSTNFLLIINIILRKKTQEFKLNEIKFAIYCSQ